MITLLQIKSFFKAVYARIVLSRFTIAFFVFSLVYCHTQGILQAVLHSADNEHGLLLTGIVRPEVLPPRNMTFFTFFTGSPGNWHLQMCKDVPHVLVTGSNKQEYPCVTVFRSSEDTANGNQSSQFSATRSIDWSTGLGVYPANSLNIPGELDGVTISLMPQTTTTISVSRKCVQGLLLPRQSLNDARREDLALIALQFWLFTISVIAVVNDSVPHLLTVLITRAFVTGWSGFSVWRTFRDRDMYQEIFANPGTPCSLDLFSSYFERRIRLQISDLVLSGTALVIFVYLTVMLLKAYNSHAFRCVGAPDHIYRINKYFLALLACLQLELFIITTGMGMWIDVLLNTAIGKVTPLMKIYIAAFIGTVVALPPWITMGWFAIKREKRWMMNVFLALSFGILAGWMIMFYSIVYRWTFLQWPFLGCYTVASHTLVVASLVLGVVCRINFGKGHAEYLQAEEALSALNFTREVFTRNEREESFDLRPVSPKDSKSRSLPFSKEKERGDQPLSVYYIQTLESDGVGGVQGVADTKKGPFGFV